MGQGVEFFFIVFGAFPREDAGAIDFGKLFEEEAVGVRFP